MAVTFQNLLPDCRKRKCAPAPPGCMMETRYALDSEDAHPVMSGGMEIRCKLACLQNRVL